LASSKELFSPYSVLDQTKPQAPVWRENFGRLVGRRHARCEGGGRRGSMKGCLMRNGVGRSSLLREIKT